MSVKERVYQALKTRNYFSEKEKEYLELLEKTKKLQDLIIKVKRNCNCDNFYFKYNPITHMFHRIKDKELLKREYHYKVRLQCIFSKCLNTRINVRTFIKLLNLQFEAVAIYHTSEINI